MTSTYGRNTFANAFLNQYGILADFSGYLADCSGLVAIMVV